MTKRNEKLRDKTERRKGNTENEKRENDKKKGRRIGRMVKR